MDGERFLSRGVGAATCKNGGKTVGTGKKEAPPNQAAKKNTENSTGKSGKFEKKIDNVPLPRASRRQQRTAIIYFGM